MSVIEVRFLYTLNTSGRTSKFRNLPILCTWWYINKSLTSSVVTCITSLRTQMTCLAPATTQLSLLEWNLKRFFKHRMLLVSIYKIKVKNNSFALFRGLPTKAVRYIKVYNKSSSIFKSLLTRVVHLVNDQLDALFLNVFISTPLHVSSSKCSSSGGPTCINTPSGVTHSGNKRV